MLNLTIFRFINWPFVSSRNRKNNKVFTSILSCIAICSLSLYSIKAQNTPEQLKLTKEFLAGKSAKELRIMRNEIFARYGYKFSSDYLADYFSKKRWYNAESKNVMDDLTAIDIHNINLIKDFEETPKSYELRYSDTTANLLKQRIFVVTEDDDHFVFDAHREISIDTVFDWVIKRDLTHGGTESNYNIFTIESLEKPIIRTHYVRDVILFQDFYITTPREVNIVEDDINRFYGDTQRKSIFSFNKNLIEVEDKESRTLFIGYSNINWESRKDEFYIGTLYCFQPKDKLYELEIFAENQEEYHMYEKHYAADITIKDQNLNDTHSKYIKQIEINSLDNFELEIIIKPPYMEDKEVNIKIKNGLINGINLKQQVLKI